MLEDSDQYFQEAISKILLSIPKPQDLDYLRSFGLLAVYSLHRGNHGDFNHYLGLYHALVAQHSFHNENRCLVEFPSLTWTIAVSSFSASIILRFTLHVCSATRSAC